MFDKANLSNLSNHTRPFYIVGPYKYGPLTLPRINLFTYAITLLIYTALLPFLTKINRTYFNLPKIAIYLLYFVYTIALFYFFGTVTIGYIVYQNTRSLGYTIYEETPLSKISIPHIPYTTSTTSTMSTTSTYR